MKNKYIFITFFCLILVSSCVSDASGKSKLNDKSDLKYKDFVFKIGDRKSLLESVYYFDRNNSTVSRANPDPNRPLKILVHGFTETKQEINADGYITDMKNAILKFVNKY